MREILFKAKSIATGEWLEGNLVLTPNADEDFKAIIIPFNDNGEYTEGARDECLGFETWYKVDTTTICQFTGLNDKNGNKIWENDVVKKHFYTDYDAYANSEEYVGAVEFEDYAWVIKEKIDNRVCVRPIIESIAYSEDVKHFEVIVNIFYNKDLIGE